MLSISDHNFLTYNIKFNYIGFYFLPRQVQICDKLLVLQISKNTIFSTQQYVFIWSSVTIFDQSMDVFKMCHSVKFLSKYTTIDTSSCYNRGKSTTAVAGCSKKMNRYFVQCQPYFMAGVYTETIFMNIRNGKYLRVSAISAVEFLCKWNVYVLRWPEIFMIPAKRCAFISM